MQNFVGKQIDRYRITERLGMGGMAVVYKAYDTRLERDVALKIIRTEVIAPEHFGRLMKRFEREAKAQASFSHPNIVPVYNYGEWQGAPYLVMEYIDGGTLKEKTGQPVAISQALRWTIPIADALAYAHDLGVVHRDIKPGNILFDCEGRPVLADFGIAKVLESTEATLTGTGMGVGTPEYMAPEQWHGEASPATDQYALGVVLYELITGQKPYQADTPAALAIMQVTEPLRAPSRLVQGIPDALEKALYKAMARHPQDRYPDMGAFQKAMQALLITAESQTAESEGGKRPIPDADQPEPDVDKTVDELEAKPVDTFPGEVAQKPDTKAEDGKKGFPKWALWVGIGVVSLCLVGGTLTAALGGFSWLLVNRNKETQTEPVAVGVNEDDTPLESMETKRPAFTLTATIKPTTSPTSTITPTSTPKWQKGDTEVNKRDDAEMVFVPAGEFLMGSEDSDAHADEGPEHIVYTDAFWIYKQHVTNDQFAAFVNSTGHVTTAEEIGYTMILLDGWWRRIDGSSWIAPKSSWDDLEGRGDHPVIHVSWYDAKAYCQWAGGRLPTEAEWEKVARSGTGQTYPWGEAAPSCELANYGGCVLDTQPVGSYPNSASPYGALDMAGNVWNWVTDWYGENYYAHSSGDNPQGPSSGAVRVVRGASWFDGASQLRAANREESEPDITNDIIGIRCILDDLP